VHHSFLNQEPFEPQEHPLLLEAPSFEVL
jgi:hypothetical protein